MSTPSRIGDIYKKRIGTGDNKKKHSESRAVTRVRGIEGVKKLKQKVRLFTGRRDHWAQSISGGKGREKEKKKDWRKRTTNTGGGGWG